VPLAPAVENTPPAPARADVPAVTTPALGVPAIEAAPEQHGQQPLATTTSAPSARRARTRHVSRRAAAPAATPAPPPAPIRNKPKGVECESSAECRSKLCVAYICQ
jgi:hypothetical protein